MKNNLFTFCMPANPFSPESSQTIHDELMLFIGLQSVHQTLHNNRGLFAENLIEACKMKHKYECPKY